MKKIFFALAFTFLAITSFAQSTLPRFGTNPNQDNTFRTLTGHFFAIRDTTGFDSVNVHPNGYENIYTIHLLDSFSVATPVITQSFCGDKIRFIVQGASATKLQFKGSNWITTGTATLSTKGRAIIDFVFDGTNYTEVTRTVQ